MEVFLWGLVINQVPSKIPQDLMARIQAAVTRPDASVYMKVYFIIIIIIFIYSKWVVTRWQ
jgi:hypothetical protein